MKVFLISIAVLLSSINILIAASCLRDQVEQEKRSKELQEIYRGDQDDRKEIEANLDKPWPKDVIEKMSRSDAKRRRQVAKIFADGCFKSSADYAAAAMVYQHGIVPDHFFQTFLWSKRAVELGDNSQKHLMALGIDRYLMNLGQRQLFGSQAKKIKADDICWCLFPVEPSFTEELRQQYLGKSLEEQKAWIKEINGKNVCPEIECKTEVKDTPKGSIPGFW
jgi:hypothetical protein